MPARIARATYSVRRLPLQRGDVAAPSDSSSECWRSFTTRLWIVGSGSGSERARGAAVRLQQRQRFGLLRSKARLRPRPQRRRCRRKSLSILTLDENAQAARIEGPHSWRPDVNERTPVKDAQRANECCFRAINAGIATSPEVVAERRRGYPPTRQVGPSRQRNRRGASVFRPTV